MQKAVIASQDHPAKEVIGLSGSGYFPTNNSGISM